MPLTSFGPLPANNLRTLHIQLWQRVPSSVGTMAATDSWSPRLAWEPRVARSVFTSCLVAAPLGLGIAIGHSRAGTTASLGAYLWTIGHLTVPRPVGPRVIVTTVMLLALAGATGAFAGGNLGVLVGLGIAWAVLQAVTDTAASALRVPTAMSALCFFLSAMYGSTGITGAVWRGILVLAGATWLAGWEIIRHRSWKSKRRGTPNVDVREIRDAWPRARGFSLLLSIPTALSAAIAGIFDISHGAWMATTVLRVLRPEASSTVARTGRRIAGTVAGALLAALLLATERHDLTAIIALVLCVSAMQLVGPKRYGYFTFFLTLVALELAAVSQEASWGTALIRIGLTLAGSVIAVASGLLYERLTGAPRARAS